MTSSISVSDTTTNTAHSSAPAPSASTSSASDTAKFSGTDFSSPALSAADEAPTITLAENQAHSVTAAPPSLADRALENIQFHNTTDSFRNVEADFDQYDAATYERNFQGNVQNVKEAIHTYAHSPRGNEVLGAIINSDSPLGIIYDPQGAAGANNVIEWDGNDKNHPRLGKMDAETIFAHEIGHTIFGGERQDYPGQLRAGFPTNNVEHHENTYRRWANQPDRTLYINTDTTPDSCYNQHGQSKACP